MAQPFLALLECLPKRSSMAEDKSKYLKVFSKRFCFLAHTPTPEPLAWEQRRIFGRGGQKRWPEIRLCSQATEPPVCWSLCSRHFHFPYIEPSGASMTDVQGLKGAKNRGGGGGLGSFLSFPAPPPAPFIFRDLTIRQRRRPWKGLWKIDFAAF